MYTLSSTLASDIQLAASLEVSKQFTSEIGQFDGEA